MVFFLLSFSDLSHHRTCGSAYGGSLSYVQSDIAVHQTRMAGGTEFIIGRGVVHYTFRICPISLAAVAVDSCPRWLYATSYQGRFGALYPLECVRSGPNMNKSRQRRGWREGSQIDSIASCPRGQDKFMGGRDEPGARSNGRWGMGRIRSKRSCSRRRICCWGSSS